MDYRTRQEINTHNELVYRLRQEKRIAGKDDYSSTPQKRVSIKEKIKKLLTFTLRKKV